MKLSLWSSPFDPTLPGYVTAFRPETPGLHFETKAWSRADGGSLMSHRPYRNNILPVYFCRSPVCDWLNWEYAWQSSDQSSPRSGYRPPRWIRTTDMAHHELNHSLEYLHLHLRLVFAKLVLDTIYQVYWRVWFRNWLLLAYRGSMAPTMKPT